MNKELIKQHIENIDVIELNTLNKSNKCLISVEYNEISEDYYIKIVLARNDLLCANVFYEKEVNTLIKIAFKLKCDEYQIYSDVCDKLKEKNCISFNIFFSESDKK